MECEEQNGDFSSCNVQFSPVLAHFNADNHLLTHTVSEICENHDMTDSMVIGTSAIVDTEINGAVNLFSSNTVEFLNLI